MTVSDSSSQSWIDRFAHRHLEQKHGCYPRLPKIASDEGFRVPHNPSKTGCSLVDHGNLRQSVQQIGFPSLSVVLALSYFGESRTLNTEDES